MTIIARLFIGILFTLIVELCTESKSFDVSTPFTNMVKEDSVYAFAPELSIKGNTYKGCFSEDYLTFYFLRENKRKKDTYIPYQSTFANGKWQEPSTMAYFDSTYSYTYQILAPNRNKFIFLSNKKNSLSKDRDPYYYYSFWSIERNLDKGTLQELGPTNLLSNYNSQPSITKDGTIYFMSSKPGVRGKTAYYLTYQDIGNQNAKPFTPINKFNEDEQMLIANIAMHPEEKYMILAIRMVAKQTWKDLDFYISYNENGNWTKPALLTLKGLNTDNIEAFPYITHDGKYFMFTRNRSQFFITSTENFEKQNK